MINRIKIDMYSDLVGMAGMAGMAVVGMAVVGMAGFEPAASCSQIKSSQPAVGSGEVPSVH